MSVPPHISHAREVLQRFIVRDDEALLSTVRSARQQMREPTKGLIRKRWRLAIDLRIPAPLEGRPRSRAGGTSFHFAARCLTKDHRALRLDRSKAWNGSMSSSAASDPATAFERYVTAEPSQADAAASSGHNAEEAKPLAREPGDGGERPSRAVLIVSNISDKAEEREAFWKQAWAAERTPGRQRVELFGDRGKVADWQAIEDDKDTPSAVASAAGSIVAARLSSPMGILPKRYRRTPSCQVVVLADDDATAWAEGFGDRFGKTRSERLIHYPKPRGGRVQEQIDAELPAECDDVDVRAIVMALAEDLTAIGVPFTIVVHAPDATNDPRNQHLHLIWYPGRCNRSEDGMWLFGGKPGEPAKLRPGEIAIRLGAIEADGRSRLPFFKAAGADIGAMRARFAGHVNARLEARGSDRRYDPRTYDEMGIDKTPEEHLGTATAKLVAAGVTVDIDVRNALTSWSAVHRRRELALSTRAYNYQNVMQRIRQDLDKNDLPQDASHRALDRQLERYRDAANEVIDGRAELDRFDLERAEATSAARRLLLGTARLIEADEAGRARADDAKNRCFIRARHRMAEQHLAEIKDALDPFIVHIEQYRKRLAMLEHHLEEMEVKAVDRIRARRAERMRVRDGSTPTREGGPHPMSDHHSLEALRASTSPDTQRKAAPSSSTIRPSREGDHVAIESTRSSNYNGFGHPGHVEQTPGTPASIAKYEASQIRRIIDFIEQHGIDVLAKADRPNDPEDIWAVKALYSTYCDRPAFVKALRAHEERHTARGRVVTQIPAATSHDAATYAAPADALTSVGSNEKTTPVSVPISVPSAITSEDRGVVTPSPDLRDNSPAGGGTLLPKRQGDGTTVCASTITDRDPAGVSSNGNQQAAAPPHVPKTNPPAPDVEGATRIAAAAPMPARMMAPPDELEIWKVIEHRPVSSVEKAGLDTTGEIDVRSPHATLAAPSSQADLTPSYTGPLAAAIGPVRSGSANLEGSISAAGYSGRARPGREAPAFHEASALHGVPTIRDGKPGGVVRLPDLASPTDITTGIDPGVRDIDVRLDTALSPDPVADCPAREAQPAPAVDPETIIANLHALQFLPLRRTSRDDGRSYSFHLVVKEAAPDDAAVLRQAKMLDEAQRQQLYAARWMAMCEQLRMMLTTGSRKALSHALISGLRAGDPHTKVTLLAAGWDARLLVALRTAGNDPGIDNEIVNSREYWRGEMGKNLMLRMKNRSIKVAADEVRPRLNEGHDGDVALDVLAQLSRNWGQGR